jgi:hypothetical protein
MMIFDDMTQLTPRDNDLPANSEVFSPARKRVRGKAFKLFGGKDGDESKENIEESKENVANDCNMFQLSQDSTSFSHFSQDFTDRMGHMSVKSSQDNSTHSILINEESTVSNMSADGFSKPFLPSSKLLINKAVKPVNSKSVSLFSRVTSKNENEMQIDVPQPIKNIFLKSASNIYKDINVPIPTKKQSKLWISAFKERSRFVTDYEELGMLGVGNFSTVHCMRHRVDGNIYAVKRIKERIMNETHGNLLVRETCALSVLQGCKNIIRYCTSWIDDHYLCILTEYCSLGTLEDLISSKPSSSSIMSDKRVKSAAQLGRSESFHVLKSRIKTDEPVVNVEPYLIQEKGISEELAWKIFLEIGNALNFMHSKRFFYYYCYYLFYLLLFFIIFI